MITERLLETANKIFDFCMIEPNWHYGAGEVPKMETVQIALHINQELGRAGFRKTNAFLGVDGQIVVTGYHDSMCFEATVETDGSITIAHEVNDVDVDYKENASLDETRQYIHIIGKQIWGLYGSFIPTITIPTGSASGALNSNLRAKITESPLFTQNVFPSLVVDSASIFQDTIKVSPEPRLFFGASTPRFYPKNASMSSKQPILETVATTTSKD